MSWEDQARSVIDGLSIFSNAAFFADMNADQLNLVMAAMFGLAHLPGSPLKFRRQAQKLVLDGVAGQTLHTTYEMLGTLIADA